jgi:iron complex transport system substrate-binding protein
MVAAAGGTSVLGVAGEKSFRVGWDDVRAAAPDVVVCAPCGFGLEQSVALARILHPDVVGPSPIAARVR